MATSPVNTRRTYKSLQVRCAPDIHRQWQEICALQKVLDDRTYFVRGREHRANRILRRALRNYRWRLLCDLAKLPNAPDPDAIIAEWRARKGVTVKPPMPEVEPFSFVRGDSDTEYGRANRCVHDD